MRRAASASGDGGASASAGGEGASAFAFVAIVAGEAALRGQHSGVVGLLIVVRRPTGVAAEQ